MTRTNHNGASKPRNPFTVDTLHAAPGHGNASAPNASLWTYPGSGIAGPAASISGSSTPGAFTPGRSLNCTEDGYPPTDHGLWTERRHKRTPSRSARAKSRR